jgi:hypothetical protein
MENHLMNPPLTPLLIHPKITRYSIKILPRFFKLYNNHNPAYLYEFNPTLLLLSLFPGVYDRRTANNCSWSFVG